MNMCRTTCLFAVAWIVSLSLSGCDRPEKESTSATESPRAEADEAAPDQTHASKSSPEPSDKSAAKPGAGAGGAVEAYHQMDGRKPLPLTPMMAHHQRQQMRDHLAAVQEIVVAAGKKDFEGVHEAAKRIGSSPEMRQMCNHMGAGAEGFTDKALGFHETADGIIEAAKNENYEGVMTSLGETLNTCTSCHAQYKQKIVTDDVWQEKTGMGAPSGEMQKKHHGGHH